MKCTYQPSRPDLQCEVNWLHPVRQVHAEVSDLDGLRSPCDVSDLNPPVCSVRDGDGVRDDDVYVVVLPMI